jgi:ABC-type Na+ transport system ATPase subunit NatA
MSAGRDGERVFQSESARRNHAKGANMHVLKELVSSDQGHITITRQDIDNYTVSMTKTFGCSETKEHWLYR